MIKKNKNLLPSSSGGLYQDNNNEINAAICRIIKVTSCNASQINWKNVLGGLGGIELQPKTALRSSKSLCDPLKPKIIYIVVFFFK